MTSLAQAILPLISHLELRMPSAPAHREAVASAQTALRDLPLHRQVAEAIGAERAEAITLLMLAIDGILTPVQQAALNQLTRAETDHAALAGELSNVRAQLAALWKHAKVVTLPRQRPSEQRLRKKSGCSRPGRARLV